MAYAITKLYKETSSHLTFYHPTEYTPVEFNKFTQLNTRLYIAVTDDSDDIYGLDYSKLITDTTLGNVPTWTAFCKKLTQALVDGYFTTIPGYYAGTTIPRKTIKSWDVMNTLKTFNVDYANRHTGVSGLYPYRWNLRDLKISLQPDNKIKPDLSYCVPIVNGLICRPYYDDQKEILYAQDGASYCWQTEQHRTPEVMLMDFAALGEISIGTLTTDHEATDKFRVDFNNRYGDFDIAADWTVQCPVSLNDYTPIFVIEGMAIFPDQYQVISNTTVRFTNHAYPLHKTLAYRTYLQAQANSNAEVAYTTVDLEDDLETQLKANRTDTSATCFVILVKTPRLLISRVPVDIWRNGVTINLYTSEGLLLHDATGTIRVYHKDTLSDRKELTLQNLSDIYRADYPIDEQQLVFVRPDMHDTPPFNNIQHGNATMIYVMGE